MDIKQYTARFYDPWDVSADEEIVLFSAPSDRKAKRIMAGLCSERENAFEDKAHTWGSYEPFRLAP